jgi:hypothetical protein
MSRPNAITILNDEDIELAPVDGIFEILETVTAELGSAGLGSVGIF